MKKRIITLSTIFILIVALIITGIFLFRIQNVDIANASEFVLIGREDVSLLKKKLSSYEGRNILFLKSDEVTSDLERFMPYVCVENVAREFPNSIVVSISERKELFALKGRKDGADGYFILDKELKVLKHQADYSDSYADDEVDNLILLDGINYNENDATDEDDVRNLKIGDKLVLKNASKQNFITSIAAAYLGKTSLVFSNETEVQKFIYSVDLSGSNSTNGIIYLKDGASESKGCKIYFNTYSDRIIKQVQALMSVTGAKDGIFNGYYKDGSEVYIIPQVGGSFSVQVRTKS